MAISNARRKNTPVTIGEFPDKATWRWMAINQPLTKDFTLENISKLDVELLLTNQKLDDITREYLQLIR